MATWKVVPGVLHWSNMVPRVPRARAADEMAAVKAAVKPKGRLYNPKYGSLEYFLVCGWGGILSCGITHTAMTPVDFVKCNKQNNPELFPKGMFGNLGIVLKKRGFGNIARGWAPTMVGYSLQGLGKFGLYEVFKYHYSHIIGTDNAIKYNKLLYIAASASAEFFADILLCPWETVKLKVQTVDMGPWLEGKSGGYASGLVGGTARLWKEEGFKGMYQVLSPLWSRQIPYTIIKFVAFEAIIGSIYEATEKNWGRPKMSYNKAEQLGFTFIAGYSAGVICGAVSHPFDTMTSLMSKNPEMPGGAFGKMATLYSKGFGTTPATQFRGLWGGLGPRVFMIGTLTAMQWFIYDAVKVRFGIATTGGIKKDDDE